MKQIFVAGDNLSNYLDRFACEAHIRAGHVEGYRECRQSPCAEVRTHLSHWDNAKALLEV